MPLAPCDQPLRLSSPLVCQQAMMAQQQLQQPQLVFAASSVQGKRAYQEDHFAIASDLGPRDEGGLNAQPSLPPLAYAAVFDGHGGDAVSLHCARQLGRLLQQGIYGPHLSATTPNCQQQAQHMFEDTSIQQALLDSFARCDFQLTDEAATMCGSTAVCALMAPDRVWVASCGDSRAVIAQRGGNAVALTDDHKPERPDELKRVMAAGGYVFWNGGYRVMGALSMSRAMGNKFLKKYGVISTPEVHSVPRSSEDELLILASDGLWVVMSNDQAARLALACVEKARRHGHERHAALKLASQMLINIALQQGSRDNITVVLLDMTTPGSHVHATSGDHVEPVTAHLPQHSPVSRADDQVIADDVKGVGSKRASPEPDFADTDMAATLKRSKTVDMVPQQEQPQHIAPVPAASKPPSKVGLNRQQPHPHAVGVIRLISLPQAGGGMGAAAAPGLVRPVMVVQKSS